MKLQECFDNYEEDLEVATKKWLKILSTAMKSSFKKIRLKKSGISPELDKLFKQKEDIKARKAILGDLTDSAIAEELEIVEMKIAKLCT